MKANTVLSYSLLKFDVGNMDLHASILYASSGINGLQFCLIASMCDNRETWTDENRTSNTITAYA